MSDQEIATPTADAVTTDSAPVNEAHVEQAVTTDSAPVETTTEQNTEEGSEPEQSKAVKELIAQRKRRQQAEQDAAYWRGVAEARGGKQETTPAPVVQAPTNQAPVAPNSDQFETWEDYEKAKDKYLIAQAKYEIIQESRKQQFASAQQQKQATFQRRMEEASKEDPTITEIVQDRTLPLHERALSIVYESDVAPQLLKALNNDRKEATRLFQLFNTNPILAAREFGKLEAKLANAPKPTPPKKVSQAPTPISTVTATGSGTVDEDNLPVDQWIARRNKAQFGR